jgi:hypothetical protein
MLYVVYTLNPPVLVFMLIIDQGISTIGDVDPKSQGTGIQ